MCYLLFISRGNNQTARRKLFGFWVIEKFCLSSLTPRPLHWRVIDCNCRPTDRVFWLRLNFRYRSNDFLFSYFSRVDSLFCFVFLLLVRSLVGSFSRHIKLSVPSCAAADDDGGDYDYYYYYYWAKASADAHKEQRRNEKGIKKKKSSFWKKKQTFLITGNELDVNQMALSLQQCN